MIAVSDMHLKNLAKTLSVQQILFSPVFKSFFFVKRYVHVYIFNTSLSFHLFFFTFLPNNGQYLIVSVHCCKVLYKKRNTTITLTIPKPD